MLLLVTAASGYDRVDRGKRAKVESRGGSRLVKVEARSDYETEAGKGGRLGRSMRLSQQDGRKGRKARSGHR